MDYNYLREPSSAKRPRGSVTGWGLAVPRFSGAWNDAKGGGAKVAIVDSGVYSEHPDIGRIIAQRTSSSQRGRWPSRRLRARHPPRNRHSGRANGQRQGRGWGMFSSANSS